MSSLAFIQSLAGPEGILILMIFLLLFGGKKMPEFARGLGKSVREFKKAAAGVEEEFKRALETDAPKMPTVTAVPAELMPAPIVPVPTVPAAPKLEDPPSPRPGNG